MLQTNHKKFFLLMISICFLFAGTCHKPASSFSPKVKGQLILLSSYIDLELVSPIKGASFVKFSHTRHYRWTGSEQYLPYEEEFRKTSNMNDFVIEAKIPQRANQIFYGQRISHNSSEDREDNLKLMISFLNPDEELIIKKSYNWMDIRAMPPIFLEGDSKNSAESLSLLVPRGVKANIAATNNKREISYSPLESEHSNKEWKTDANPEGMGKKYVFSPLNSLNKNLENKEQSDLFQVFLGFNEPKFNSPVAGFESWKRVSSYYARKMSTFDVVGDFLAQEILKKTESQKTLVKKVSHALDLLQDIKVIPDGESFLFESIKPVNRTFWQKEGGRADMVMLARAILNQLGVKNEILLAGDKTKNPIAPNIFSPYLFSKPILAVSLEKNLYYFDPSLPRNEWFNLSPNSLGQMALVVSKDMGKLIQLPNE